MGILQKWWGRSSRFTKKNMVIGVADLAAGKLKAIHPDAMHRTFIVLTRF